MRRFEKNVQTASRRLSQPLCIVKVGDRQEQLAMQQRLSSELILLSVAYSARQQSFSNSSDGLKKTVWMKYCSSADLDNHFNRANGARYAFVQGPAGICHSDREPLDLWISSYQRMIELVDEYYSMGS
jgi:hypothetical protein